MLINREELCKFVRETLSDNTTGKYSHAKVIAMFGFFAATVFIWKLIILGTLGIEFFVTYLVYCTGTQTFNKWLDSRNPAPIENKDNKES